LIEPFAGGAIVGLTAAFEELVEHVVLVELDEQVAAVWTTILNDNAEWLVDRILSFELTLNNVREALAKTNGATRECAFRTILKNRTQHGGILAPGASLIKAGEKGKGIKSRWYPETLAKRIRAIDSIKDRITFICGDGIEVVREYASKIGSVFFVDPPYSAEGKGGKRAGTRLYTHHSLDHKYLFEVLRNVSGDALITYDDAETIWLLASEYGFEVRNVAMKNTHHARMTELIIGRNLRWMD
jgi:DNA adenine methylase